MAREPKPLDFSSPPSWKWKDYRPTIEEILHVDPKAKKKTRRSFYLDDKKFRENFTGPPCEMWSGTVESQEFLRGLVPSLGGTNF
jgi:hypothetical protein